MLLGFLNKNQSTKSCFFIPGWAETHENCIKTGIFADSGKNDDKPFDASVILQ